MKLTPEVQLDIIEAYTVDLWSMQDCADALNVSRTAIHKMLNKHGIDTSKHKLEVSCTTCGKPIMRTKKRVRNQRNHFCSTDCYYAYLDAGRTMYNQNRQGQRTARAVVAKYFDLQDSHIVHHDDRNTLNNDIRNLKVFANAGDHIKYHHSQRDKYTNQLTNKSTYRKNWEKYHAFEITPLFDGITHH